MTDIADLAEHRRILDEKAEVALEHAMRLKMILQNTPSLPVPETETNDLIRALSAFLAATATYTP